MAALGLPGSHQGGNDEDEEQHSKLLENLTREQTKLGNMMPGQRFSLGDANKNIGVKAFLPTADDDDDDDDLFESEFPVEDLDKEAPAGMDEPPKRPIAGAQEQADEAMEDAAPEEATTAPTAVQDTAVRTEGLEQIAKGGRETLQPDTGMQDASDVAGRASSQQGSDQAHPDVLERKSASDEAGDNPAEDQPMTEPGSHADMLAGAETEQEAHTEPADTAILEAAPPTQQTADSARTAAAKSPELQAGNATSAGARSQPGASKARSTIAASLGGSSPAGILNTTASPPALTGINTKQQDTDGSMLPHSTAPAAATLQAAMTGGPLVNPVRAPAAAGGKAGPVHVALIGQPGQQLGSGQLNQQLGSAAIAPPLQPRRSTSPAVPSTMKVSSRLLPMPKPALGRLPQMIRVNASGHPQQPAGIPAKTPAPPANPPAAASPNSFTLARTPGMKNPGHNISPGALISSGRACTPCSAVQSHHPPQNVLAGQGNLHAALPDSGLSSRAPHNQHLQAPGSADNVQGTLGNLGGGNPTAPPLGDVVRIPNITGTAVDVGTAGTLPDQPEPKETPQLPAQGSTSQPTFHLEMVCQQRKLEQMILEAQRMTDQALELKVMAAIVGNRLTRLNNPMMAAKLQEMKRHAGELLKNVPDSFKSRPQKE